MLGLTWTFLDQFPADACEWGGVRGVEWGSARHGGAREGGSAGCQNRAGLVDVPHAGAHGGRRLCRRWCCVRRIRHQYLHGIFEPTVFAWFYVAGMHEYY